MMRVIVYIALVFALAAGFAWLADRPGALSLTWQGYRIETSIMFAAVALAAIIAAIALIGAALRSIVATPRLVGNFLGARRRDRGYRALSRGMIAVGAGDARTARRAAGESSALLSGEPLTLLLTAQAAQLSGDAAGARTAFEALAARADTRILGLHGLFVEAARQGEHEAARHFAEEATLAAPQVGWAGAALFDYQAGAGDWSGALRTLGANAEAGLVDKKTVRRRRAILLTALALEAESGDPDEARIHAQEAHKLAPELTEAAIVAGRLLARAGDLKRASRILEATWKAGPHPEIADAYAALRSGESVRDRLKRMRRLADMRPQHPESAMAVARAAIDGRDWQAAREALEPLVRSRPGERVCLLMAEIEEDENGDEGRVRQWLTRAIHAPRDPVWVAEGRVFSRWAPVSPVSGKIDAFEWKVAGEPLPLGRAPGIEADRPLSRSTELVPAAVPHAGREPAVSVELADGPVLAETAWTAGPDAGPDREDPPKDLAEAAPSTVADPVIPRAPDDPGPGPAESDNEPRRFRLFRPSA